MTALNCIVMPDGSAGYLTTDSNAYDLNTGQIYGSSSKVHTLPHATAVVACRDFSDAAEMVASHANRLSNFDDMLDHLPQLLAEEFPATAGSKPKPPVNDHLDGMEVVIMGFSARRHAVAAFGATSDEGFSFQEIPMYLAPALTQRQFVAAGIAMKGGMPVIPNAPAALMKIIEYQRSQPIRFPGGDKRVIGGSAILTTVTQKGIVHQIVRRWD